MFIDEKKLQEFGRAMALVLPQDFWGKVEFDFAGGFCIRVSPQPSIKEEIRTKLKQEKRRG